MNRTIKAALAFALLLLPLACAHGARAQDEERAAGAYDDTPRAPLSELRDKRRTLLVVTRSLAVDTRGALRVVLDEIFATPPRALPRHDYAFQLVSRKLEKYTAAGRGVTPVETVGEAEFVIVFKVLKEVRSFAPDEPFVYGEMFVIIKGTPERPEPALVWRTKSDHATPEDAVKEFVKQLKAVRGEK